MLLFGLQNLFVWEKLEIISFNYFTLVQLS